MTVAMNPSVGNAPLYLARNQGWMDLRGVQVLETTGSCDTMRQLREGQADVAALTLAETLQLRAMGMPLSVAMVFNISMGADMLLARPGITSLTALKGRRIGYDPCSVNELLLGEILREAGLSRGMVSLSEEPVAEQIQCWQAREVDVMLCSQPVASQLQALGAVRLFDSRQLPQTLLDVLVIRVDRIGSQQRAPVRELINGQLRAVRHLQTNPQDAAYRMAGQLSLPVSGVLQAFRGLLLADAARNQQLLAGKIPALLSNAERLSSLMVAHRLLPAPDRLEALVRADFLPAESIDG